MKQKIFMLLLMTTMAFGAFAQAPQGNGDNRSSRRFNPERMAKQMANELKLDDTPEKAYPSATKVNPTQPDRTRKAASRLGMPPLLCMTLEKARA